jgi:hypothetical protein
MRFIWARFYMVCLLPLHNSYHNQDSFTLWQMVLPEISSMNFPLSTHTMKNLKLQAHLKSTKQSVALASWLESLWWGCTTGPIKNNWERLQLLIGTWEMAKVTKLLLQVPWERITAQRCLASFCMVLSSRMVVAWHLPPSTEDSVFKRTEWHNSESCIVSMHRLVPLDHWYQSLGKLLQVIFTAKA